jgi:hypothetical protein
MTRCRRCESEDVDVSAAHGLARCRSCQLVFDPSERSRTRPRPVAPAGSALWEAPIDAPDGVTAIESRRAPRIDYRNDGKGETIALRIEQRAAPPDRRFAGLWMVLGMAAVSPLAVWLLRSAESVGPTLTGLGATLVLFSPAIYGLAIVALNRVTILVGEGLLVVRHGPLPRLGNRRILSADVEQLYAESYEQIEPTHRHERREYRVLAMVRGRHRPLELVSGLKTPEHALFLESTIERVLGIEDRIVVGELHKRRKR